MEKSCFFNSVSGDRKYDAEILANYFATFINNGVFYDSGAALGTNASIDNDMSVYIQPGKAFINGYLYENTEPLKVPLSNASATLSRIDRIVVRLDLSAREIRIKVLSSAYSANPTPPEIVRNAEFWDLCISEILIPAGSKTTYLKYMTDKRMSNELCGFVAALGQKIDTTELETLVEKWSNILDTIDDKIKDAAAIKKYDGTDISNNITVTDADYTPKNGDLIAVHLTNPSGGLSAGATITFNGDKSPIQTLDGTALASDIACYATILLAYTRYSWILHSYNGGEKNETIPFPSGGIVTPKDGVNLYIGQATSDVTIGRASSGSTNITATIIFRKGSATNLTFAPDYRFSDINIISLSAYSSTDYIVVDIKNGAPVVSKTA